MATSGRKAVWRRVFSRRRVVAYVGLYLVLLSIGCAISLTDKLVMIPSTQPVKLNDVERVTIDNGDVGALDLYRRKSSATTRPEAYVLEFIGNADRAEWIASFSGAAFAGHRVDAYAVNYPGYGQSSGPPRLKLAADAGLVAYDWLRGRAGDRPILIVGRSLGTTVALRVAAERPDVAGLFLTNPPPLRQLIRGRFGWWNLWLAATPISWGVPGELNSIGNARRATMPAVFVTSGKDELVPLKYQRMVVEAYAGEKRIVTRVGAGHNTETSGDDAIEVAAQLRWLWQRAVADKSSPPLD